MSFKDLDNKFLEHTSSIWSYEISVEKIENILIEQTHTLQSIILINFNTTFEIYL